MALTHTKPGEVVDLMTPHGDLAFEKSTAIVKTGQFEAIRLVLEAGSKMQEHQMPAQFTLQCLEGHAVLLHDGHASPLRPGSWIFLDNEVPYAVEAVERSILLLTIILAG